MSNDHSPFLEIEHASLQECVNNGVVDLNEEEPAKNHPSTHIAEPAEGKISQCLLALI